ncbi:hypothetical protein LXD69_08145 [Flavobacterium sediminilitoris]|uniref:Carboxypeptidase regulatory-like domain-containing protein n=1 Tax=Flavobacterium sediminilitoris TaxID=2024526 RepID=A0ABY4HS79_9FLAO|nr:MULTISPECIES: hypothetical protein [Flavobacterium]UOX35480.1 hypothetical protein LXD69_08145 [Flavobacterium sediminilitoris]
MKKIPFLMIIIFLTSSCVTRLKTPKIEGRVYNVKNEPLKEVKVCLNDECVNTNEKGYFSFNKKTYKEFVMIGGEAPAVIYNLKFSKQTYKDTIINYKNLFGGSNVDLLIKYDSIILHEE